MTMHYCSSQQLKPTLLPGWRGVPGPLRASDTPFYNLRIQCTQNHGEQMVSLNIKRIHVNTHRPADWISRRFCLDLPPGCSIHAHKIKLLYDIQYFMHFTTYSVQSLMFFVLPSTKTQSLIEINSTEWQKSDDHTPIQLVLTLLGSLSFSFQNRDWYPHASRYRSDINITEGDERFRL